MESPIQHRTVSVIETQVTSSTSGNAAFAPFAIDECLLQQVQEGTALHFWEMTNTVILGMTDTKTPYLQDGVAVLRDSEQLPVVRQAGGLAVVSDAGVLNVSLVFRHESASITQAYEWMQALIEAAFPEATGELAIHAHEVSDSYCPGDFDLSIQGQKFAGIAQRRFKNAICVSIYLSVTGDQLARGRLIRQFYDASLKGEETRWHFPEVRPESMATLEELLDLPLTTKAVKDRIVNALYQWQCTIVDDTTDYPDTATYHTAIDRFRKRNTILE